MKKSSVEIYSIPTCPDCKAAKEFLKNHNISYTEHDVSEHPDQADALRNLTGKQIIPTIIIGKKLFIGFAANRQDIESLLIDGQCFSITFVSEGPSETPTARAEKSSLAA